MDITYYLHKALEKAERDEGYNADMLFNDDELDSAEPCCVESDNDDELDDAEPYDGIDNDDELVAGGAELAGGQNNPDFFEESKCLTDDDESLVRGAAEIIKSLRVKAARAENDLELNYAKELSAAASFLEDRLKG